MNFIIGSMKNLFLLFSLSTFFSIASCEEISEKYRNQFDKVDVINALDKAFSCLWKNLKELDDEPIMTVIIAYGQLKLLNEKYGGEQSARLKLLESTAKKIYETHKRTVSLNYTIYDERIAKIFREKILDSELWMKIGSNIDKSMSCKGNENLFLSVNKANSTINDQYLSASNECLGDLLLQKNNLTNNSCEMSENCRSTIFEKPAWGYGLSHRLLYFMVAKGMDCQFQIPFEEFCCKHGEEMDKMKEINFPGPSFKDLFIEEALFCTLVGFRNFVNDEIVSLSLKWQRSEGCWGFQVPKDLKRRRTKRTSHAFGKSWCATHFTGLNVAYLAVALRHYYQ